MTRAPVSSRSHLVEAIIELFLRDNRLWVVGELSVVQPLIEAAVSESEGLLSVDAAAIYDAFLAKGIDERAGMRFMLSIERRAGKLGATVHQAVPVQSLTAGQRTTLLAESGEPQSGPVPAARPRAPLPAAPATAAPAAIARKRLSGRVKAAIIGVALLALIGVLVVSLPERLEDVSFAAPPGGIPCASLKTKNGYLFCVVDEAALGAASDVTIRNRIKINQEDATKRGHRAVMFLRPGPDQRRFKPHLWQRPAAGAPETK